MSVLRYKKNGFRNGEHVSDFEVETSADLSNQEFGVGDHVYVAAEKKTYVKKSDGTWAELPGSTTLEYNDSEQVPTIAIR